MDRNEPLHLIVPATLASARAATDRIVQLCARLDEHGRATYALAVMEWLVNIVKHSYRFQPQGQIVIRANVSSDAIELVIEDTGRGLSTERFNAAPAQVRFDPDDIAGLPESGMGLAIIKSSMDSVDYTCRDGVNRLVAVRRWRR